MRYIIIGNALELLTAEVNEKIELGWKPLGGVSAVKVIIDGHHDTTILYQAMVKEE